MHSITESDGIPSDPYEVLCHMAALIIEGRTPLHISKGIVDCSVSGENVGKPPKPYHEGPHCPNFMKLFNKESSNIHKCSENNVLCIRFSKLKQRLLYLFDKSIPITIEVFLGPDCLCGELRSQSTLVSSTPCKRDILLEHWTISVNNKRGHEASQMSVMNLYQAVRSLLHFSQLTAWYMKNTGMKPANVIYRVGVPGDSAFVTDDNFVKHDFPVADVNKGVSMKISVRSAPRMESIPSVYCPQHSCGHADSAQSIHQEVKDFSSLNKDKKCLTHGIASTLGMVVQDELTDLPLKFQGVRKKTYKYNERKSKNRLLRLTGVNPGRPDLCDCLEYLDTIADKKAAKSKNLVGMYDCFGNNSKPTYRSVSIKTLNVKEESPMWNMGLPMADLEKSKASKFLGDLCIPHNSFDTVDTHTWKFEDMEVVKPKLKLRALNGKLSPNEEERGLRSGESLDDSAFLRFDSQGSESTAKLEVVDDRMQISCGISGKHHCKCEYEEEVDNLSLEKPRRRRSLGKARPSEASDDGATPSAETDRILHGKFKEVDCRATGSHLESEYQKLDTVTLKTIKRSIQSESSKCITPVKKKSLKSLSETSDYRAGETLVEAAAAAACSESLPMKGKKCEARSDLDADSSVSDEEEKTWRMDSGICMKGEKPVVEDVVKKPESTVAESDAKGVDYNSDEEWESSANPFMAAILRTTRKCKAPKDDEANEGTQKVCDNSQNILCNRELDENEDMNNNNNNNNNNCDYSVYKKIDNDIFLHKLKELGKSMEKKSDTKTKVVVVPEESADSVREFAVPMETCHAVQTSTPAIRCKHRTNLDLRLEHRLSAVRNLSNFGTGDCHPENCGPSEFISKSLSRLKSLFDKRDFATEDGEKLRTDYDTEDNGSNNINSTKTIPVPSAQDKLKFRRSLDSAAQLVFHRCSGLPLTSSPAPVRRNNSSFSFDSSLNSVSAIKSALFDSANSISSEDENESEGSLRSPASPGAWSIGSKSINYHSLSPLPLLGTFEESVLNGRLEPVSTVHGFTAELGASGSFCPRHLYLPVTVFFYTLGDNDKVSAPYLGHINLGKKGYNVPRSGTIQVTLFNPMRTVVKMFVVVYDLHDMPPNSHTFLRQRTLYVPASQKESIYFDKKDTPFEHEDYHKYLRYLIHLRFISGKTGRIYLHTDIRMIIFRKADEDTATALGRQVDGEMFELRSHTHGPTNPKFSPRK